MVNDGIAAFCAKSPDRFKGFGTVPMPDGNEAAKELERCVKQLGFTGVEVIDQRRRQGIVRSGLRAVLEKSRRARRAGDDPSQRLHRGVALRRFYFNNVIGNPLETTIALHYLIFDGVLERHPKLKILAVHGGGYLGAYSGRIDHAWGARSDSHGDLPQPPTTLSQAHLCRHRRVHAESARRTGARVRRRSCRHGHRLSLRHGRIRSDRPYRRSRVSMRRPSRRLPAATPKSCWGCGSGDWLTCPRHARN